MVVTLRISIPVCIEPVVKASDPIKMPYFPYWPADNGCQLIKRNNVFNDVIADGEVWNITCKYI